MQGQGIAGDGVQGMHCLVACWELRSMIQHSGNWQRRTSWSQPRRSPVAALSQPCRSPPKQRRTIPDSPHPQHTTHTSTHPSPPFTPYLTCSVVSPPPLLAVWCSPLPYLPSLTCSVVLPLPLLAVWCSPLPYLPSLTCSVVPPFPYLQSGAPSSLTCSVV